MVQTMITHNCFVYGTLMSPEVVQTLIGRVPKGPMCKPAFLPDYTRHPVKGYKFPGIIPSLSSPNADRTVVGIGCQGVSGLLLCGLTQKEMKIFDWFEADEYTRLIQTIQVIPPSEVQNDPIEVEANVYVWTAGNEYLNLEKEWDYEHFRSIELNSYLKYTVRPCRDEIDHMGVGDTP